MWNELADDRMPAQPPVGSPTAIEPCCGAGGMTIGLQRAGFRVEGVTGWDIDAAAVATAQANGHRVIEADINHVNWAEHQGLTLFAAGVPCQPFSRYGLSLGEFDARDCFPAAIRGIAESRPDVVMLENVAGLGFRKFGPYVAAIVDAIADLGYTVETKVIDCADFGTPQNRKRWLLLASRHGAPVWAEPSFGPGRLMPHRTVAQAFGWADDDPRRYENEGRRAQIEAATRVPMSVDPTQKWEPIVFDHEPWMWERPGLTIAGRRLLPAPGANANRKNTALKGKNDGIRIDHAQMGRLQGFPGDYVFTGTLSQIDKQIGNAFPPQPAEAHTRALTRHLLGDRADTPPEGILL